MQCKIAFNNSNNLPSVSTALFKVSFQIISYHKDYELGVLDYF